MSKKSPKARKAEQKNNATKIDSEDKAIAYLENMVQKWIQSGNIIRTETMLGINYIPKEYRTPKVIEYVLSRFSNVYKEMKLFPAESFTEEVLIQTAILEPSILDKVLSIEIVKAYDSTKSPEEEEVTEVSKVEIVKSHVSEFMKENPEIYKEKLSIPVLVAYEIGNRQNRKPGQTFYYMGIEVKQSNFIDLLEMYFYYCMDTKSKEIVYRVADEISEEIEQLNLKPAFSSLAILRLGGLPLDTRGKCLKRISTLIQEKSKEIIEAGIDIEDSTEEIEETYQPKYKKVAVASGQKLVILIGGHSDSGKTTLSRYISRKFVKANCFDSNDLMGDFEPNKGFIDFWAELHELIDSDDGVVIYSDPKVLLIDSDDAQDIIDAMGDPKVVRVLIKPEDGCIEKMLSRAKGNWKGRGQRNKEEVISHTEQYEKMADLVLENNYTPARMQKMADDVIDYIRDNYPMVLNVIEFGESGARPDAADFAKRVGKARIEEGAGKIDARGVFRSELEMC